MDAAGGAGAPASHFPTPPAFYKLYGDRGTGAPPPPPPPPIAEGVVTVFGRALDPNEPQTPPLQAVQLFRSDEAGRVDIKAELKRLCKELLLQFATLLQKITDEPTNHAAAVTRLNQLLQNMQHLVNRLRPVQARSSLAHILRREAEAKEAALQKLRAQSAEADRLLLAAAEALASIDRGAGTMDTG